MVRFTGLFFNGTETEKLIRLEPIRLIKNPKTFHCTFKYKPTIEEVLSFNEIVGEEGTVLVDGHGHDEDNTGYRLIIPKNLLFYFQNYDENGLLKVPHITMSLSLKGKPVNTCKLRFEELEEPFKVTGRFGFFVDGKNEPLYEKQMILK